MFIILFTGADPAAGREKASKDATAAMSQAELQSQVMAFADRYFSIMIAGFNEYRAQSPPPEEYKELLTICTYSVSSAFTIAAEPNPVGALLDMTVMVTLGRIIFQAAPPEKYGAPIQSLIKGFGKAERDIWQVAANVLTPAQQEELYRLIHKWRKENPEVLFFPSVRFSDFSAQRSEMEKKESSGLFESVEKATQQVEEVRLLAERGMFLATRMPMLTGLFAGIWFSQLANHPDMEKVLNDINIFSESSKRLAAVAEQLPDKIATERDITIKQAMKDINALTITAINQTSKMTLGMIDESARKISQERQAAIRQLMDAFSAERKRTIEEFLSEDQRMRGLLSELRLTIAEGSKLIGSADSLAKGLHLESKNETTGPPAKPFDIKDYRDTLREASNTILQAQELVKTLNGLELGKMMPQILQGVNTVEKKGQRWMLFGFVLGVALILVSLAGVVIALLVYHRYVGVRNPAPPR